MKQGGRSFGGFRVAGGYGVSRSLLSIAIVLLFAVLAFGMGGCAGGTQPGAGPTSVPSTVSSLATEDPGADLSTAVSESADISAGASPTATEGPPSSDETTTSTSAPIGEPGARRNPIPMGREARVGDWIVTVVGAELNATKTILDENMFNDPPDSGSQYVMVRVTATYAGGESSTFWVDTLCRFVGGRGDAYESGLAVAPDPILDQGEVFTGGVVSGNLVFKVASNQVTGGTLQLEDAFACDKDQVYFAVD